LFCFFVLTDVNICVQSTLLFFVLGWVHSPVGAAS
jgi:hypothetical protein